jgi:hypothetical protein
MTKEFAAIVRSAAVAGWWTVLIAAVWLTAVWLIWRSILKSKPAWLMKLWGFDLEWKEVQQIMFYFIAIMKMILFIFILICIWLTLWA